MKLKSVELLLHFIDYEFCFYVKNCVGHVNTWPNKWLSHMVSIWMSIRTAHFQHYGVSLAHLPQSKTILQLYLFSSRYTYNTKGASHNDHGPQESVWFIHFSHTSKIFSRTERKKNYFSYSPLLFSSLCLTFIEHNNSIQSVQTFSLTHQFRDHLYQQ